KAAVEYKEYCGRVLAARNGVPGPDLVPHPDDVIIDYARGEVHIDGPLTAEQKAGQEWLRAMAPDLGHKLMEINQGIGAETNNFDLRRHRRELTKVINWLGEDNIKKITRDTLRRARDNPKTTETK